MTDAPLTPTSLPPAARLACSTALSTPSVTKVNGEPSFAHSPGTVCVTTIVGSPPGGLPPHAPARSNVLRPTSVAPVVHVSRRRSALARETLKPNSDRKSTRLNSSHSQISYAVFCL